MYNAHLRWCIVAAAIIQIFDVSIAVKILGIYPFQARSHAFVVTSLMVELAKRGHEVTVLTHNPYKEEIANFTQIVVKTTMLDVVKNKATPTNLFELQDVGLLRKILDLWHRNQATCDLMLQEEDIQKLIHAKGLQFDLVIVEAFFNECFLGFVHKFKAPLIHLCTFGGVHWIGDWVGNPNPYAYVPDAFLQYTDRMGFWERMVNSLVGTAMKLGRQYYYLPAQDAVMRKHFNDSEDLPSVAEIEYTTSLVLLNHHFSISYPRPLMPNMVQVGGMHLQPPKKLPQELQKFLDEAPDGVIYFSMGSNLRSSLLSDYKRDAFLEAFSELKQKVLWKWETDNLPGQPSNVRLGKWFPQADILAHPNVRLFMTHGGLLSTQEALDRGVPVVGIPVFGDQSQNMERAQSAGYGVMVSYHNITAKSVKWALKEVLGNNRYRENAQRLSRIYRDQPLTPLQQAVFWTEYVIRHKGAPHMRSAALDLTWYQYFLLDVIAVLTVSVGSALFLLFLMLRAVLKQVWSVKNIDKPRIKGD